MLKYNGGTEMKIRLIIVGVETFRGLQSYTHNPGRRLCLEGRRLCSKKIMAQRMNLGPETCLGVRSPDGFYVHERARLVQKNSQ